MRYVIKILTPFIYATALLPSLILTLFLSTHPVNVSIGDGSSSILLLPFGGFIPNFIILFVIFTPIIFWLANFLIYHLEGAGKPKISDHLRQSSLYYALLIATPFLWQSLRASPNFDNKPLIILFVLGLISVTAIIFNFFYFIYRAEKIIWINEWINNFRRWLRRFWPLLVVIILLLVGSTIFYANNSLQDRKVAHEELWQQVLKEHEPDQAEIDFITAAGRYDQNLLKAYEMLSSEAKQKISFATFSNALSLVQLSDIFEKAGLGNVFSSEDLCGDYSVEAPHLFKMKTIRENGVWKILSFQKCN